ncbi:DUF4430 domain-containing protein [Acholeplasma vituli]|uniref:DUF4430 domain-containing protein n=1 Tax=Paracholeplasma vituli TaxID=69473 RepID=A0ABT2PXJ9_9MOLU|nr:DUF4430 domain-containing protein [Paracholeplasma vituli]MCU0105686.1 DUF4430 domain-containing protein [Paracholeplasma vituli]
MSNWIKKVLLVVFVLTLTFGLSACQTKPEEGDQVTVTVELYNQTLLVSKEFKVNENVSAEAVLEEYLTATYETFSFGKMLKTLTYQTHQLIPGDQEFIAFYVNGESSMVGVTEYYVKANDVLSFKLESWS